MTGSKAGARRAALVAAMQRLPGCAVPDGRLNQIAADMDVTSGIAGVNDLPRAQDATPAATRKELKKLRDMCAQLVRHISGMHSPALRAIEGEINNRPIHPFVLDDDLALLAGAADRALKNVPANGAGRRGRHEQKRSARTAKACAVIFEELTGSRPARRVDYGAESGPWVEFVREVFEILGLGASPANAARKAMEEMAPK